MNTDPSRAPSLSLVPRLLLLAGGTVLLASSCESTPTTDDNIFAPGKPRYGYGSPQKPGTPGTGLATKKTESRNVPDIKRDPNNTTVDVTPPESKTEKKTDSTTPPDSTETTTPSDTPTTTDKPVEPETTETKPAAPREDLPFGQPVVGKKGYVYSPYAPDKGQVDVDGIPAGTKVKCPYTGKVFRVP